MKHNPWINNNILKEIKDRDKLYSKHKKATDTARKEELSLQLRNQKIKVKNLLQLSKKQYFSQYFQDHSANAKKLWEGVNQIIASKSKPNSSINCLEIKDDTNNTTSVTNPKLISNIANKYYTNIAGDIPKTSKYKGNKHFKQSPKTPNTIKF